MTVRSLPPRVHYSAWDKTAQEFKDSDQANHTLTFRRDGTTFTPTNAPTFIANGVYEVVLTDAERVGEVLLVSGVSSTTDIVIQPVSYAAEPRIESMTAASGSDNKKATYTQDAHSSLRARGDAAWITATGFTVPGDLSGLALETSVQAIATTGGTGPWTTATGFTTPSDLNGLALESTAQSILSTGGTGPWTTADVSGTQDWTDTERNQIRHRIGIDGTQAAPTTNVPSLALEASVQSVLTTGGSGPWTTATGFTVPGDLSDLALEASVQTVLSTGGTGPWTTGSGGSTTDWTEAEREQIRHRIGIDGTQTAPLTNTPSLALEASVQTVITTGGSGPWTTADVSGLALEASVQSVLSTGGTGPWTTATGFTTPGDLSGLALEATLTLVKSTTDKIKFTDHGGGNTQVICDVESWQAVPLTGTPMIFDNVTDPKWTAIALQEAPGGGSGVTDWDATERAQIRKRLGIDGATSTPAASPDLALEASVQTVITTGGAGPWTTGSGGGGEKDWTDTERSHIRHRLGIDGTAVAPAATPSLAIEASVQAIITTGGAGPWTTATGFATPGDLTGLALESSVQSILTTGGTGPWTTASGFATPADLNPLATSAELAAMQTHGDATWSTATGFATPGDLTGLALEASVQNVLSTGGTGPWTTANVSGLALESSVQSVLTTGGPGPWTTANIGAGIDVNVITWNGSAAAVQEWEVQVSSIKSGVVVDTTSFTPTATEFETNLTESLPDHWKNRSVIMLTGGLKHQASLIEGYTQVGGKGRITVAGFTNAPGNGDQLVIV